MAASSALRAMVVASSMALALAGCGGSAMVRSSFSGAHGGAPSAPSAPAGSGQGLNAGVSGNLGLVIVLGLVLADIVHWTSTKLKETFPAENAPPSSDKQ